jgi:hypothetical protein
MDAERVNTGQSEVKKKVGGNKMPTTERKRSG